MKLNLYQLRYKGRFQVETAFVEATTIEKAAELGRAWCDASQQRAFLSVSDPVVAREGEPLLAAEAVAPALPGAPIYPNVKGKSA